MLLLSFYIGPEQYAVSAKQIIEILPLISVKLIPGAPAYVAGLLDYRGLPIPVIDLCQLTNGHEYNKVLSSRIVLVHYTGNDRETHPLGLIAEKVTETLNIPEEKFLSSGITLENVPYLGGLANTNSKMIQYVEINKLLTQQVQSILFNEDIENQQASNQ
ncbi:MAG: chemotaxis protein CheW [Gammaproteobacteria bacterium]